MELGDWGKIDFLNKQVVLEVSKSIAPYGTIKLDLEIALIDILKLAASKTDNKIDDALVDMIAKALNP